MLSYIDLDVMNIAYLLCFNTIWLCSCHIHVYKFNVVCNFTLQDRSSLGGKFVLLQKWNLQGQVIEYAKAVALFLNPTICPTLRLDVMELPVDCVFQASYHKICL